MKPPLEHGHSDDFQTPPEALNPLLPYLVSGSTIWECAAGKGNLVRHLSSIGFNVISSDIITGQDFRMWEPDIPYDYIITNPPYAIKQQFLERCYQLARPFALLLPLTTLETPRRQELMRVHGIEIILMPKRVNFETPSGEGTGSWFAVAWFTFGLNIGKQLTFWNE